MTLAAWTEVDLAGPGPPTLNGASATLVGRELMILTGKLESRMELYVLDLDSGTWDRPAKIKGDAPRAYHLPDVTYVEHRLVVACLDQAERYLRPQPRPRPHLAVLDLDVLEWNQVEVPAEVELGWGSLAVSCMPSSTCFSLVQSDNSPHFQLDVLELASGCHGSILVPREPGQDACCQTIARGNQCLRFVGEYFDSILVVDVEHKDGSVRRTSQNCLLGATEIGTALTADFFVVLAGHTAGRDHQLHLRLAVLDLRSLRWTTIDIPSDFPRIEAHAMVILDNQLLVLGSGSAQAWRLDLSALGVFLAPPSPALHNLRALLADQWGADLEIVPTSGALSVTDQPVRVHRLIVSRASAHLGRMLQSKFAEASSGRIFLPEPRPVIVALVRYLYGDDCLWALPTTVVCRLLALAHMYMADHLMALCCERLKLRLAVSNAARIMQVAAWLELPDLEDAACAFAANHFRALVQRSADFRRLIGATQGWLDSSDELAPDKIDAQPAWDWDWDETSLEPLS